MHTDVIVQDSNDNFTEIKTLTSPSFMALMYELEDYITHGWRISQDVAPDSNFTLYEVVLNKNAGTINRVKERIDKIAAGHEQVTTDKRRENMAKARETRKAKIAERKGQKDES